MSTTDRDSDDRQMLSSEEIDQTFDQLQLNDPKVREFYRQLHDLSANQQPDYWLRATIHSLAPSSGQ